MSVITLGRQTRRIIPWRTIGAITALVLLLLVAVIVYVGGQRRVAPPFGLAANGAIAYVKTDATFENQTGYLEPYGDILAVEPATGTTTTIVDGPELDGEPAYSLDGTRLSFVRKVDGGFALYAIDSRGGSPTRLTTDPLPAIREAAWSPDGRTIAFTVASDGRSDLWIAKSDGSDAHRLDVGVSAVAPQWRPPNGDELLFVGSAQPGLEGLGAYHGLFGFEDATSLALYLARPDGTQVRRITPSTGRKFDYAWTTWTPDGQRIVTQVHTGNDFLNIQTLDVQGREIDRIATGVMEDSMAPLVSPDGHRIAYVVVPDGEGTWRVHIRRIDGTGDEVTSSQRFDGGASTFRWSPDGTLLVVNQHYYPGTWLVDAASGASRKAPWTDPGYASFQRVAKD